MKLTRNQYVVSWHESKQEKDAWSTWHVKVGIQGNKQGEISEFLAWHLHTWIHYYLTSKDKELLRVTNYG